MPSAPIDPPTILVVENEAVVRMFLAEMLEDLGFTVEQAASAAEAMKQFRALVGCVVAIILDIGLPDVRGDNLVAEIRAEHAEMPIVLMTGYEVGPLRERFKDDRRLALRLKPFGHDAVVSALQGLRVQIPTARL